MAIMADTFDPYRERLIIETETVWPAEYDHLSRMEKARLEMKLHSEPDKAANLEYVRLHTGFLRRITVTQADLDRLPGHAAA
jgi:hypothetical protein